MFEGLIREKALTSNLLNKNQYIYQCGKSCESPRHFLVSKVEDVTLKGKLEIGVHVTLKASLTVRLFKNFVMSPESMVSLNIK